MDVKDYSDAAGAASVVFGKTSLSSPSVTLADTIISSSLISRRKSAPSTTYPKLFYKMEQKRRIHISHSN